MTTYHGSWSIRSIRIRVTVSSSTFYVHKRPEKLSTCAACKWGLHWNYFVSKLSSNQREKDTKPIIIVSAKVVTCIAFSSRNEIVSNHWLLRLTTTLLPLLLHFDHSVSLVCAIIYIQRHAVAPDTTALTAKLQCALKTIDSLIPN